jgi:hypothetical protein
MHVLIQLSMVSPPDRVDFLVVLFRALKLELHIGVTGGKAFLPLHVYGGGEQVRFLAVSQSKMNTLWENYGAAGYRCCVLT